ncbi:pyridoxamine 5'-phosphate oxidase [Mucilaginibacter terrenus]|uniref:Pyridoxine/pyridoxamine 5'-phosphate oxidase n=1 Tax=Mucilaginibacter terrenus TaxID=2482727 RepID=A0A3E2NTN2_9SPHI|nr:pyridoxamine 5'-phosphate oxidase [Mucilaginibacter terrenus]RFZ84364.1 pyridoxamine 5'-phosphate oxidase [Mucilaginibacter terrenus]
MDQEQIENLRQDYSAASLNETDVDANPMRQFDKWFNEAINAKIHEPNAMTLATSTHDGRPSARIVLLKGFSDDGFKFYTNYLSRKGRELSKNPMGALVFFWGDLERQVRVEGTIEKLDKDYSEKYFHSRPKKSQLGAVASPQSQEINGREMLEERMAQLEAEYADKDVPKPSYWGGYVLRPRLIEFWQGRRSRLHDRIVYKKTDNKNWKIVRLAP